MVNAIGNPIQNRRIRIAIAALRISNGAGGGVLLSGTIIKVVTAQAKIPYSSPVTIIFFESNFTLGKSQKKKIVSPNAII
jgi:hypothetical protein